jgi:hypothetical protein
MKASRVKYINDEVTLYHTDLPVRRDLLRYLFVNSVDGMRFYDFLAKRSRLPVIGKLIKIIMKFQDMKDEQFFNRLR